ncbi:MAG TPA: hypothetical protein VKS60_11415, partial [Stellaceae bacterium]|nr:hypothetical protein [Stellaceae bacterium]
KFLRTLQAWYGGKIADRGLDALRTYLSDTPVPAPADLECCARSLENCLFIQDAHRNHLVTHLRALAAGHSSRMLVAALVDIAIENSRPYELAPVAEALDGVASNLADVASAIGNPDAYRRRCAD